MDRISIDSSNGTEDSVEVYVSKINYMAFDNNNSRGISHYAVEADSKELNDSMNTTIFVTCSKSTIGRRNQIYDFLINLMNLKIISDMIN